MKIKLNLKLLNKLTAILVVGCFFVSSVCRDAIAVAATPTMNAQEYKQIFTDFMLPYSYGKISGSHFAGTDRVVINIQDLHCHPQVQKSISNIIEMFDNKYGVSNVYLEGAYGNVSAKPFLKNLINPTQRNEILDKLLQSGRLTGAEYYSAISNKTEIIKGLENKCPYLENLKRFGNLLEAQDQIAVILKGVEESTKKVKEQYYTRRQYKIEKLSKDYLEGKIKAEKYYRLLAKHTEKLGIDLTKYENTFLYMQLLALQSDLNYKAITTQLQTLVLLLKENLPPNAYQILLDNTKNFEETDKLYAYVIKLSKSFGLDLAINFKELDKYFSFIELSQRINPLELLKEEENLTREINTRFSDTIAQREVVFLTNFEKYLKDYLSTKITSQDYEYYKENIETYKKLWNKYVDNKVLTLLEPYMKETDKFYKINTDRNNYFTENIFDGIETNKIEDIKEDPNEVSKIIENMDKVKRVDVIITGGFHSQTVSEILKQHGISYIVITPNVQDGVKEAEKTYYQIAKQQKEINFQTLAARVVFDLLGDESLSQIVRIKVLKDYNLSKQEVKDIIGANVENRLLEDIFNLTDKEFIKKYNPQYDNNLQHVFGNTSAVIGLINVAEQLESDDISPTNFKKLTEIVAKEYGISNEQKIEQIAQRAIKIIENGEESSLLDNFINIFESGNQDIVLTVLEIYNNYNPKTIDSFLEEKTENFEYDKENGLYKFENGKKIYLKDYKIVSKAPIESSKESKKLEQQEISTEKNFYKEVEEKIENFDFSLDHPNRIIVEENIKNLNVIIDEISISELLNDEERMSLTKKLEDKVVDLIYPKADKKEGLNILRKSTKNTLIPGNVMTTSMFVKDMLESKLSDGAKIKIVEGINVNDIEDNRTKNKVLEIKEQIEKGKAVLETGLEEEKAKENLRLNMQNLEAKEEQLRLEKEKEDLERELEQENLRDKEEQLRLDKEKEDLEKASQKNIDKTDKEKKTSTLLDLVTPKFSSKGAALLVTIVTTIATLFIPTWSSFASQDTDEEEQEQKEQQKKNKDTATMLSVFSPFAKKFENTKMIGSIFSFLDKTAPIWEELVFRAIPMTMSPGIFIVSQIIFVLLHFKDLNKKEKLTVTALTIGLSSIYVGMSICFPGTLPLAYTIAMIIHAINNKYGQVKLSIFDKVKNIFGGNKKDDKLKLILEALDNDSKDFFVKFIKFAEVENKEEAENLLYILNKITASSGTTTLAKEFIDIIINIKKYNIVNSISNEELNEKNVKEIINFIDINSLKNMYDNNNYNPSRAFHEINKNIIGKIIDELRNNEMNVVQELDDSIKEKICDNFGDFLFTKDGISLLKNLLRQNNDSIEQILDSFAGIKQFDYDVLSRQIWFRERSFIPNFKTFLSNEKNIDNFSSFIGKLENKLNAKDNYSATDRNAIRTDLLMFLFRDEEIFDYFINSKESQDILLSNLSVVNIESDKEYNGAIDFYRLPTDVGINLLMGYIKPVNLKEWYIQSPVNTNQISKMETTINPIFKCGDERIFWEENKEVAKQRNCNDADETRSLFNAFCNSGVDVSKNSSIDKIFKEKTGFSIDEIKNGITKDIMFRRNEKDLEKEQIKYSSEDIIAMYSDDIVYAIATIMKQKDEKENNIRNTNFSKLTKEIKYSFKCPLFDGPCFVPYSEILNTGYVIGDCTGSLASGKNNVYFRNHRIFLKNFNTIIYYKNGKLIQKYMIHYDDDNMHIMSVEEHQDFRDNKNNQEDSEIDFKEQFFFESLDFMHNIAGKKSIYIETLNSNTGWLMETIGQITTKDKSESINLLTQGGLDYLLKLNVNFEDIDAKIDEIKEKSKKIKAYRLLTGAGVYGNLVTVMYEIQDFIRDIDEYKYKNDENKGILYRQMQMKIQKEKNSITDDDFARKIKIEQKENDLTKNMNNVLKLESILNNENIEMKDNEIKITGNTDVFDNFINKFSEIVRYVPTHKLPGNEKGEQGFVLPIGNNRNIEVELVKNGNVNLVNKKRYTKIEDESKVNRNIPKGYKEDIKNKIKDEINKEKVKQIKYNFKNENINEDNKDKYEIEVIGIKEDGNLEVTFEIYREKEKIGVCTCEINITDDLKVYIEEDIENDSIETKLITDNEMEIFMDKIRSYNLNDRVKNKIKEKNISEVVIPFTPEKINESRLVESKTVNAKFNQQGTAISQNTYDTTKEEVNLTTQTVNLLRKSLNPVGALSEISIEFLGSGIINADKLFLYSHDISEAELKKAENDGCTSIKYRIVNEAETSRGVSNIKIKQEEGKADIRVKYDDKNNEVIIYSKDGIRNLSNKEIQVLVKQAFREGRRIKVFSKVGTLTFATGREKNSNDIMNTMNVETIDSSVTAPTENVYKFASDEKFMPTTISGKVKETGLSTFEISKEHYDEYGSKEQDCKFIVRETNTNNIEQTFDNIGDNQSGVSFDFSETNIVNQESILNSIKEQKGKSKKAMNLSVYVKFNYEVYEKLSGINIFEQYGIIPIVDKNSVSIVKGKKMLDIDEENKIEDIEKLKNQSDIFGFMFDENSVDKLGSVISGIRTIIEYLTNDKSIYSPQEKFKDGLHKALNSRSLKKSKEDRFNCTINNLTEIQSLKELLQIDISQEKANDRIKEQLNSLNLSKIFTNDALIYIEDLISKDNNIEALGFIRGVVMNTVADEISKELSGKGIGDVDITDSIKDNEVQGILIWTIQNLLEGKAIEDLYNSNKDTFEIGTAEEIFESIRLDLNRILAENEYKINLTKERSTITKSEELPTLIMSDYGKKSIAEKEFNVSANAIKSMLAAA